MVSGTQRAGLQHLNGNIMCVLDCETSGDQPGFHDLLSICVMALDYKLDIWTEIKPYYFELMPKRKENYGLKSEWRDEELRKKVNPQLMARASISGIDPDRAADFFGEWFEQIGLKPGKKIIPLAHNWPHDRDFILDWLGREAFELYFDARYRDTMMAASFMNDRSDFHTEPYMYPKVDLTYIAKTLKVETSRIHDAMMDCLVTAEVYKKIVSNWQ